MNDITTLSWTLSEATQFKTIMPSSFGPSANTAVILADFVVLPETVEDKFRRLKFEWEEKTINLSSLDEMIAHPAYASIIKMGRPIIPSLLSELKVAPNHWFYALRKITGENPIPKRAAGNLQMMTSAWLDWGRKNGFL
jgi:hypothetical protein